MRRESKRTVTATRDVWVISCECCGTENEEGRPDSGIGWSVLYTSAPGVGGIASLDPSLPALDFCPACGPDVRIALADFIGLKQAELARTRKARERRTDQ